MSQIISKVQVENNDVVSFLDDTTYIRSMSQILPQSPTYISYRYDTITISQVGGEAFSFTVYTITDVGGNAFAVLGLKDAPAVIQKKTTDIYKLLVTSIFKGCCECGDTMPECSIQYTAGDVMTLGRFQYDGSSILFNYVTGNNQDFTGFFPIVQDGSWVFVFSKTDPTVYVVVQLSNFVDNGTYCKFDAIELNANGVPFVEGTQFCVDFTSVGGSLVQGWQDTLDINSTLDKDNTVDGAGYNFTFDNNASFVINSAGGSVETDADGASLNAGAQRVFVTGGYVDIITPLYASATTGMVLALDAGGHVEYTEAGTGTISSIELVMPPAFTVSDPNPLTSNGTFTVTVDGLVTEYINGLGELATFPAYTVANGLHTQEDPASDYVFHLGGTLIEDTTITTTDGLNQYQFSVAGTAAQDTQFPFGVANLGIGGVATFQDYGSGFRPNPSVEVVGDVDLFQPLLELRMEGNLPAGGPLDDRIAMLRLKYQGEPSLAATSIDYEFINDGVSPDYFIGGRLTTEVTSYTQGDEQSKFKIELFDGGSRADKLVVQGKGQLELPEYATSTFSDGTTNISTTLAYFIGVDNTGKVWKATAGTGTVISVGVTAGTGISASVANPTTTPVITITNTAPDQIVSLTAGTGISTSGTYPNFTITNSAPDQVVSLTAGSNVTITGAYPNFTIAASGGGGGGLTSVGLTMPTAFTVTNSPLTANGTIGVSLGGLSTQYLDGTGNLQTLPVYTANNGLIQNPTYNFQLGAETLSGTSDFTANRFINTGDKQLLLSGIANGTTSSAPLRIVNTYTGSNQAYALSLQSGIDATSFGGVLKITAIGGPYGILCNTVNGTGVDVTSTSAQGIVVRSYASNGLSAITTVSNSPSIAAIDATKTGSSSGNDDVLKLSKISSSAASAGIKNSIAFYNGNSTNGSSGIIAGRISYSFTDPTNASQDAKYHVSVVENNIDNTRMEIASSGQLKLNAYITSTAFASSSGSSVGVLNVDNAGNVFVGSGGTGSSPLTTKGDLYTYDTADARLPVGTNGYILSADSAEATGLKWIVAPSGTTPGLQDVITQDPVLTASNTIDGGGFNLTFDNNYKVDVNTTGYSQMTSTGSSGSVASILVDTLTASGAVTMTGTASGGATTSITTKSTEIQIKTPLYATKAAGDVLKLVNPTTGEAEWGTATASSVGLEAILMLMGA